MANKLAIITPSYRGDFEYAVDLCRSIDDHFKAEFDHIIIVPRRDLRLFECFVTVTRKVIAEEELTRNYGFLRVPLPTRLAIPGFAIWKRKQQWFLPGAGLINGWAMQQIIKLSAPQLTDSEELILVDSDVELFRDFNPEMLWDSGRFKLHQNLEGATTPTLQVWRETARKLLGLHRISNEGNVNYIGNLIPWLRSNVLKLQAHLKSIHGEEWWTVLAKRKYFSEYMLYGVFCREVLSELSGNIFTDIALYNSIWTDEQTVSTESLLRSLLPSHVALHIQSTIPLAISERRRIMKEVAIRANTSDALFTTGDG